MKDKMGKSKNKKRKGTPQPYRGHKSYINFLGRFVGVFEDIINKQLTAETEIKKRFPNSANYFNNNIRRHVGHSTSDKMDKVLNRKGITLAYNGSNCLLYELCRHIRNSYCHMLLEVDGDILKVHDKSKGKITSRGYLLKETFLDFVKSMVNEYENSFK